MTDEDLFDRTKTELGPRKKDTMVPEIPEVPEVPQIGTDKQSLIYQYGKKKFGDEGQKMNGLPKNATKVPGIGMGKLKFEAHRETKNQTMTDEELYDQIMR